MKILVIEDEEHIAEGIRFNLEAEGHSVHLAHDAEHGLDHLGTESVDLIVLDVMLPGMDGFEAARTIRARGIYTPILMLTARGSSEDVLEGFAAGADDYLPKPFELKIFLARVSGLLRRAEWAKQQPAAESPTERIEINGKVIDFLNLELRSGEAVHHLTLMEINLLRYLIENAGNAVSRKTILEQVWGLQEDTDTRAIDNFIVRLRRYLEDDPADPQILKTVRGVGYKVVLRP